MLTLVDGKNKLNVYVGDLHLHTTYSDGRDPLCLLTEIVNLAYDFVAITDHDTTDGASAIQELVAKYEMPLLVMSGAEISVGGHILSIGTDSRF